MPKPTQEELDDEAARSRPLAYFNFAETYWTAAKALRRSKAKATHKDSPIRFLYYHAIELYLKAHLRACGIHPYDMRSKLKHDVGKLSAKSAELGLNFDDKDFEIFELMSKTDAVIRSRYILTGAFTWPDISELNSTCLSLRKSVGAALRKIGDCQSQSVMCHAVTTAFQTIKSGVGNSVFFVQTDSDFDKLSISHRSFDSMCCGLFSANTFWMSLGFGISAIPTLLTERH